MIKILGILDIISSIILFTMPFNISLPNKLILTFALYLIIKGVLFILNIASIIDIVGGIFLLVSMTNFTIPRMIVFIVAFLLIQKGIFSLLAES